LWSAQEVEKGPETARNDLSLSWLDSGRPFGEIPLIFNSLQMALIFAFSPKNSPVGPGFALNAYFQ